MAYVRSRVWAVKQEVHQAPSQARQWLRCMPEFVQIIPDLKVTQLWHLRQGMPQVHHFVSIHVWPARGKTWMKGKWGKLFNQKWFKCKVRSNGTIMKINHRSTFFLKQDCHSSSHNNCGIITTWVTFEGCLCQDLASSFKAINAAPRGGTKRWTPGWCPHSNQPLSDNGGI